MDIIREVTHHVNPGQIPVLTVDQPLYAIAKRIQWKWPDEWGATLCYTDGRSPYRNGYVESDW